MQNKHTPGPWKQRQALENNAPMYYAITHGNWGAPTIAKVYGNGESDARLISMAPELLELLKEMESAWNDGVTCNFPRGCQFSHKVMEAIKKVEGANG